MALKDGCYLCMQSTSEGKNNLDRGNREFGVCAGNSKDIYFDEGRDYRRKK